MTIDDMISALEDARGQVGGRAPVVLEDDGRGWPVEITEVGTRDAMAVIR